MFLKGWHERKRHNKLQKVSGNFFQQVFHPSRYSFVQIDRISTQWTRRRQQNEGPRQKNHRGQNFTGTKCGLFLFGVSLEFFSI